MMTFETFFKGCEAVEGSAPGRVNLLGEHTDENDGFALPAATPMRTHVAVAASRDDAFHFYSHTLQDRVVLGRRGRLASGYGRYIEGCIRVLEQRGFEIPPLRIHVRSSLPCGAGLSSSSALQVATLRALRTFLGLPLTDIEVAHIGQAAERTYAGVECGITDQMAASLCDDKRMLFLDTRSLRSEVTSLPLDTELLVLDSGVPRTHGASKCHQRRAECRVAALALGVRSLRDVACPTHLERIEEPYRRRARHVVRENARVLRAAKGVGASDFGALMDASHASLRDDYDVSTAELDLLCDLLRAQPHVYGARLTGTGAACVALCDAGTAAGVGQAVLASYNRQGRMGCVLIPAAPGSGERP